MHVVSNSEVSKVLQFETIMPLSLPYYKNSPAVQGVFEALKALRFDAAKKEFKVSNEAWEKFTCARDVLMVDLHELTHPNAFQVHVNAQDVQKIQQFAQAVQAVQAVHAKAVPVMKPIQPVQIKEAPIVVPPAITPTVVKPIFVEPARQPEFAQGGVTVVKSQGPAHITRNLLISGGAFSVVGFAFGLATVFFFPPIAAIGLFLLLLGIGLLAGGFIKYAVDVKQATKYQ